MLSVPSFGWGISSMEARHLLLGTLGPLGRYIGYRGKFLSLQGADTMAHLGDGRGIHVWSSAEGI